MVTDSFLVRFAGSVSIRSVTLGTLVFAISTISACGGGRARAGAGTPRVGLHYEGTTGYVGRYMSAQLENDDASCPLPWEATVRGVDGELPPGLSFEPPDGDIAGTPRESGIWRFRVLVDDLTCGDHAPGSVAVSVTITIEELQRRDDQDAQDPTARAPADAGRDDRGGLPSCGRSIAYDVNDAGWIVGTVDVPGEGTLPVLWVGDSVIRLGSLSDRHYGVARAVDELGRVVGTSVGEDRREHGFLWVAGEMTDLAPLRHAVGIDGRGWILGNREPRPTEALLWIDGEVTGLGSLGAEQFVEARAMNVHGRAVGVAGVFGPGMERLIHAFLWEDGRMRDLTPDAVHNTAAADISDAGHVVGGLWLSETESHAFVWKDGILRDLGTFGGLIAGAVAVDDGGRFVVNVYAPEGHPPREVRALLVDGERVIDLGKLRRDDAKTEAAAMNDRGVIVGHSGERAFAWEDGAMRKLPSPVACREPELGPPTGQPLVPKAPGDVDGDGVGDEDDLCPMTPDAAIPDRHGCPMDGDDDGVMDGLDRCPDTVRGAVVGADGCAAESRSR